MKTPNYVSFVELAVLLLAILALAYAWIYHRWKTRREICWWCGNDPHLRGCPANFSSAPFCRCGRPAVDGHLTCGRMECDERAARDRRAARSAVEHLYNE